MHIYALECAHECKQSHGFYKFIQVEAGHSIKLWWKPHELYGHVFSVFNN